MPATRSFHRPLLVAACLALGACGFNGTDRYKDGEPDTAANAGQAPRASVAPASDEPEVVEMADSADRPVMQLQIVLDRQGFGPGVIDGREGLSTANAIKGFQEAHALDITGSLDEATRAALAQWSQVPATTVVRIPQSWGRAVYREVPEDRAEQAAMPSLGYESLDERLAERFHTTVAVLRELNPGGQPAGAALAAAASATPSPRAAASGAPPALFQPGQLVRVPNVDPRQPGDDGEAGWNATLASLSVAAAQPQVARIVVDKSEMWLKGYDKAGTLVALFTVTTGSSHDPLPLGEWKVTGVARNPHFAFDPSLFWDVPDREEKRQLPPGPNGPVGVVWIDLDKEHYGVHGTPDPETIGRAQSHGCVRLTNWDAARLAEMVSTATKVLFQA